MSIPPLVCCTPPPPDQCEDDKDPEDFDIQYNLSQDDDEENCDYGSFSTYDHFQSSKTNTDIPIITRVVETEKTIDASNNHSHGIEIVLGTNITVESELKFEEEASIEDLNLIIDQDALENRDITHTEISPVQSKVSEVIVDSIQETPVPDSTNDSLGIPKRCPNNLTIQSDQLVLEPSSFEQTKERLACENEIVASNDDLELLTETENHATTSLKDVDTKSEPTVQSEEQKDEVEQVKDEDDDFGDFDDFQFASAVNVPATSVESCDNPWNNNEIHDDFDNFKASFDEKENSDLRAEHSTENKPTDVRKKESDDDFGEFNDFKSSSIEPQSEPDFYLDLDQIPLLNLDAFENDEQMVEWIHENAFSGVELPELEPEEQYTVKLDSMLGVTWGHLLEVETRQPYMVNWNNSLGQTTLLQALGIDSRNILFGPKWNYNMPKYAANLSNAPLQPLKQTAILSTSNEGVNPDKTVNKPSSTWSDPFTSAGQESCASENPVIETGPTDLAVFEASTSTKPDKIFSSTLSVQPLRQINLPDTHIFTPTDSETPRSTTIHYDSSPTVILPQTSIESSKIEPDILSPQSSLKAAADNEEYWEFQNFKGATFTPTPSSSGQELPVKGELGKVDSSVSYGTQLLQPIKIEPTIPTLNWPDPGEVKETFEDFSDFVSNSSLSNQQQDLSATAIQHLNITDPKNEFDKPGPSNVIMPNETIRNELVNNIDDEFDTFQSALPSTSGLDFSFESLTSNVATNKPMNASPQVAPQIMTDFDNAFPDIEKVKSETISLENTSKSKMNLAQSQMPLFANSFEVTKSLESSTKNPPMQVSSIPMNASLLQPTPASSSSLMQNHKSVQILQPLSLESYSQINWPNPGFDLQDLSRFNPVETLQSLKTELGMNSQNKVASPVHQQKSAANNQTVDDDIWGEFVSSKPKPQQAMPKKQTATIDDDEWTDFVSSPSVKPQNGLNTISLNVHTNLNIKKSNSSKVKAKSNQLPLDIPSLNYITPKSNAHKAYNDRHFQNL